MFVEEDTAVFYKVDICIKIDAVGSNIHKKYIWLKNLFQPYSGWAFFGV